MIFTAEKKIIAIVSALLLVMMSIILFVIIPTVKDIVATKQNARQLRVYLEENYERTKKLRVSKEKITEIQSAISGYQSHIFKKGDELKLITLLETLAAKNKLQQKLDSSNLDQIQDNKISIGLTLTGEYRDLIQYTADLDKTEYFINVVGWRFAPIFTRENSAPESFTLSLTLSMYAAE